MDESLFFEASGCFKSPELAAFHATHVQGGYSTPDREAVRMLLDGGRSAEIARSWMREKGLDEAELLEIYGG